MFTISNINFNNGAYGYSNNLNGSEVMVMESSKKADDVINDFERALKVGMDPNQMIDKILHDRNYTIDDFTDTDINRINRKVEAIYKTVNSERKYR